MKVNKSENAAYFDVDKTLVLYEKKDKDSVEFNYYGEKRFLKIHKDHVSFLKALRARGFYITVWSNNGWAWAEHVVKTLRLTKYVHEAKSKPAKIIDDESPEKWLKAIYIESTNE